MLSYTERIEIYIEEMKFYIERMEFYISEMKIYIGEMECYIEEMEFYSREMECDSAEMRVKRIKIISCIIYFSRFFKGRLQAVKISRNILTQPRRSLRLVCTFLVQGDSQNSKFFKARLAFCLIVT